MPAVKNVGEPCAGEPHARFDWGAGGTRSQSASPRDTGRLSPTRPPSELHHHPQQTLTGGSGLVLLLERIEVRFDRPSKRSGRN
jgi:hypothetical protein